MIAQAEQLLQRGSSVNSSLLPAIFNIFSPNGKMIRGSISSAVLRQPHKHTIKKACLTVLKDT